MSVIRVAFIWPAIGWMGGVNYFSSLLYALHTYAEDNIKPIIFTGIHSDSYGLEAYVEVVRSPLLDKKSLSWLFSKSIKVMAGGRELLLKNLLDSHGIEVISHYNWLWKDCDIKTLSWIPDFQIMHLPAFFPEQERKQVVASITQAIQKSDAIVLSSENARSDLNTFCASKQAIETPNSYVLHFPSSFSGSLESLPSIDILRQKYNLPNEPWFHLPNQFWIHKNHNLVVRAIDNLNQKGKAPLVLATGRAEDPRNQTYVPELIEKIELAGLNDRFRVMGEIPYLDMMGLMLHAIAVINPSRFEGWSTTVEEAKAFNKKLILSEIEVHREQNPSRGLYFDIDNDEALANILAESTVIYNRGEESHISKHAFSNKEYRMKEFAESYTSLIINLKQEA